MFNLSDGSRIPCRVMVQKNEFAYSENSLFQVIDLPYGDGKYSMTVFLPRESVSVDSLIGLFNETNWEDWIGSLVLDSGWIYLPKFKLEYKIELKKVLRALGMGVAFVPFEADFTGIADIEDLHVSNVIHKTFIDVNEEGTEAAAVTAVVVGITSIGPQQEFVMRVDRPFVFVIRENQSQTLLFMGKIIDPT